jgi:hypothetical protein
MDFDFYGFQDQNPLPDGSDELAKLMPEFISCVSGGGYLGAREFPSFLNAYSFFLFFFSSSRFAFFYFPFYFV